MEIRGAPGHLPRGRRIYAIGDIHGSLPQLRDLHTQIAEDLRRRPVASAMLIHLGDYVDKGQDSRGVVDYLSGGDPIPGLPTLHLMGNHEETMLGALAGDGAAAADWLWGGGRATLDSWGVAPDAPRDSWPEAIAAHQRRFLRDLSLWHEEGGYLFVHAGIRPGVALEDQSREDLLRIRHDFLNSPRDHGFVVVHGHTAGFMPVVRENRICIDTAAWSGGGLTAVMLEGENLAFLQAK